MREICWNVTKAELFSPEFQTSQTEVLPLLYTHAWLVCFSHCFLFPGRRSLLCTLAWLVASLIISCSWQEEFSSCHSPFPNNENKTRKKRRKQSLHSTTKQRKTEASTQITIPITRQQTRYLPLKTTTCIYLASYKNPSQTDIATFKQTLQKHKKDYYHVTAWNQTTAPRHTDTQY